MYVPVVELVRHTPLLSRVGLDVNNIADAVGDQVRRQVNRTMFCSPHTTQSPCLCQLHSDRTSEAPLEHVARARAVTEGVRHLEDYGEMSPEGSSTASKVALTSSALLVVSTVCSSTNL